MVHGDVCTRQCPLLTNPLPVRLSTPCGFDGRLLACNAVKFPNGTASTYYSANCVLPAAPATAFEITSRSGQRAAPPWSCA